MQPYVVALIAFALCRLFASPPETANNFAYLADALMHGHVDVHPDGNYFVDHDTVRVPTPPTTDTTDKASRRYIIEGPFPALVVAPTLPLEYALTDSHNEFAPEGQVLASNVVGAVGMGLVWRLAMLWGVPLRRRLLLAVLVFAGTDYWWAAARGSVWLMAPVVTFALTIAALIELTTPTPGPRGPSRPRGVVVGMLAGATLLTRLTLAPVALGLYPLLLLRRGRGSERRQRLLGYVLGLMPWLVAYAAYNVARYHTPLDVGYPLYYAQDTGNATALGPFNLHYFVYEVYSLLLQMPALKNNHIILTMQGTALTFCSPALVIAGYAALRRPRLTLALGGTAVLVAVPSLFYYVNGWVQVGQRHALDWEPLLVPLLCIALADRPATPLRWWWAPLIVWSAAVGVWGLTSWNTIQP